MPTKGRKEQTFNFQEYTLMECPHLHDLYRHMPKSATPHRVVDLGFIGRHPELFTAVVALMKLRWLLRLHCAMVSFAGPRCSLVRFLKGILVDSSGVHEFPHLPMPYYDVVVESLAQKLGQAWPLFLAYVSTHDRRSTSAQGEAALAGAHSPAVVEQLIDDIWISWVAQQDVLCMPTQAVMEELSYFGMRQPKVRTNLNDLLSWGVARMQTRWRYKLAAQQQASHLALSLDLPSAWVSWVHTQEEILEMARNICAHPRTFNKGVRERVAEIHLDTAVHFSATGALCPSFARDCDAETLSLFSNFCTSPRDTGRLEPLKMETLRDSKPPRLVGREIRFPDTNGWHARRMPREDVLPSLVGGTPRPPQVSVRIV